MRIVLTDDYMKRVAASEVPGAYWDNEDGVWAVDHPDTRAISIILALFPEVSVSYPELLEMQSAAWEHARPTDYATDLDLRIDVSFENGRELFKFQDVDSGYMQGIIERDGGAFIGWSRGLGKTTAAAAMVLKNEWDRSIVVCGNTAKGPVWRAELEELLPGHVVDVIPNIKAKRERWLSNVMGKANPYDKPQVLVVHYEALAIIAGKKGKGEGWKKYGRFDAVIFDEGHKLASMVPGSTHNTQLGRATMKMRRQCDRALLLTGSPIMNKGDDLFGQLHFLFPETYRALWADWNDRFLDFVNPGYGKVCIGWKPERLKALRDELGVIMVYRTKEDELDLPPKVTETRCIPLSPAQRNAYEQMRDQFWTQLENGQILQATNRLSQLNQLRRIATGLGEHGVDDSSKIDYAVNLIEENPDETFVVFSWYKAPLGALAERLSGAGIPCHHIDGDVEPEERERRIAAFMGGEGRVFLGTLSTLSQSVNLQRASSAIFLDRSWNPAVNEQAEDRIYRIGQDHRVTITHLVAEDTVDELRVLPVLESKKALGKALGFVK